MSDLVVCKFRKSMVIHDTRCPYWDQVSLNNTNQTNLILWKPAFVKVDVYTVQLGDVLGRVHSVLRTTSSYTYALKFYLSDFLFVNEMRTYEYSLIYFAEVQEMEQNLPKSCRIHFDDVNKLHKFTLTIAPDEGYWVNGKFKFHIDVPEEYNIAVSTQWLPDRDSIFHVPEMLALTTEPSGTLINTGISECVTVWKNVWSSGYWLETRTIPMDHGSIPTAGQM